MQHTTDLRQLGGHHPPHLLSGGFFAPNSFFSPERAGMGCAGEHMGVL